MKIIFYVESLTRGGAERVVANLANKFSEEGNSVIVITDSKSDSEYSLGRQVTRFILDNKRFKFLISKNVERLKNIKNIVKKEKPYVVISFLGGPNLRNMIACGKLPVKTLISVRNDPNKEYPNFIKRSLAKFLFRRADGIVFQTEDAKKWFPDAIQNKSTIIYNQVDNTFFKTNYEGKRHDIVSVGRLETQKNQELLIRAFSHIADKIDEDLIIYGEGHLRAELEQLIKNLHMENRILLSGVVDNVAEKIKSAKLFVLSSDFEGAPNALMEAMAVGLPCISTDCPCGGPKMLFNDSTAGVLVPVGDEKSLADAMLNLLSDDERRNQLAEHAKERALDFMPEKIFTLWDEYIKSL